MTDKHDKLVEMALKSGAVNHFVQGLPDRYAFSLSELTSFRAAIIADLCGDVEPVAFMFQHSETGRVTFVDAWQKENGWAAANPRYSEVGALHGASTVAALKARVAELEESASQLAGVDLDGMVEAFHRIIDSQAQQSPFHNPVNADAALALRELRRLIPAIKAVALTKGQP